MIPVFLYPNCPTVEIGRGKGYPMRAISLFVSLVVLSSTGTAVRASDSNCGSEPYTNDQIGIQAMQGMPGDTVWGDPVAWLAAVEAGATFKASNWAERSSLMVADPKRDRYVVVSRGKSFRGMENYRKILEFGQELPLVFGRPLTDKSYTFDLWRSTSPD